MEDCGSVTVTPKVSILKTPLCLQVRGRDPLESIMLYLRTSLRSEGFTVLYQFNVHESQ